MENIKEKYLKHLKNKKDNIINDLMNNLSKKMINSKILNQYAIELKEIESKEMIINEINEIK